MTNEERLYSPKEKEASKPTDESGIPEFDELVRDFRSGEISFEALTSRLWNGGYKAATKQEAAPQSVTGDAIPIKITEWDSDNGIAKIETISGESFGSGVYEVKLFKIL